MKEWKLLDRRTIFSSVPFRIRQDKLLSPRTGLEAPYYVMECDDWVNVVAITVDQQIILVRQFRFGREVFSLEVPGGVVDPGEDPEDAAIRELREETGYEGDQVRSLGWIEPNAAIQNNRCHMFAVTGCRQVADQNLDPGEDVTVEFLDLDRLPDALRDGEIRHALSIAAFKMMGL